MNLLITTAIAFAFSTHAFAQEEAARVPAKANLEPIVDDAEYMRPAVTTKQKKVRAKRSSGSWLKLAPVASFNSTAWKGVSNNVSSNPYVASNGGDMTSKTGFGGGVKALVFDSPLQLETGLEYNQRSVSYAGYVRFSDGNSSSYVGDIGIDVSYLDVPVLARYSFTLTPGFRMFVHGGAVAGFVQSQSTNLSNVRYTYANVQGAFFPYLPTSQLSAEATLGKMNSVDFRGLGGLGGEIDVARGMAISLGADYQRSLSKINGSGPDSIVVEGFSVTAGLVFDL